EEHDPQSQRYRPPGDRARRVGAEIRAQPRHRDGCCGAGREGHSDESAECPAADAYVVRFQVFELLPTLSLHSLAQRQKVGFRSPGERGIQAGAEGLGYLWAAQRTAERLIERVIESGSWVFGHDASSCQ